MFSVKDMLRRFADTYNKDPNSNLGKLIAILHEQLAAVGDTLETVRDWRSIDAAKGTTLDRIGTNIVQPRGAATDEVYRVLLKSKIARNLSKTDVNTIIQVLALALDCAYSDIRIQEKYDDPEDPEPAAINLIRVPTKRLNEVGMSPFQFARIVQKTVAAGVRVALIELAGTFTLSSQYNVLETSPFGLADVDMTTGGTLGEVYIPGDDYPLPI
ncbi:hypothetical protein KIH86_03705 [Paenibacillus sp. HN-1]|uniref:hypothetical protein n=1 Tax=Paenibacillus TaxID=44249 RepID=UPI001CA7C77E|nr:MULTISPECIES: hypothetical protein [Paenibacillus]MBY9077288.1 hypothetical protein [Paenibacillus sp. CGMCC 1.18879]MBY9083335.1 hypothetical protein [Paenibacillus sinensis]